MTCPRCYAEFESARGVCPECGVQLLRNVSGMMKTSTVMIAAAGERGFYRSVLDVPEPLRQKLLEVTVGENSGTIVIADRAGKEQLTQVVARREAARGQSAKSAAGKTPIESQAATTPALWGLSWVVWAGILLLSGSAGVVAAVFGLHW